MPDFQDLITVQALRLWNYLFQPWTGYQLLIILISFAIAHMIGKQLEPTLEARIRTIRGNPGLLRMFAAFLRRLEWLFFIPLAWTSAIIVSAYSWPSHSYIIMLSVKLAFAWLVIAVLSRIIRTRSLARFVAFVGWTFVALEITGLFIPVRDALDAASLHMGQYRISALTVLQGVVLVFGLLWLANFTGNFADRRIQQLEDLTPSLRVLLGKFVKISLMILALAVALSGVGIDLTALTIFSGAVGVGIGFGLQKVVSNFISGIIILLDKSIKPGDTISLGDTFGWIRELRARFVSVITRDGKEYLIPNEDFITQQVVNWSFSDELVRLDVYFTVTYDSDPHEITRIAVETARSIKRVVNSKSPVCWLTDFGENGLRFILRFWISDPQNGLTNIRGTVLLAIWDEFKKAGVEIPYTRREIIMKTPVELAQAGMPDAAPAPRRRKKPSA